MSIIRPIAPSVSWRRSRSRPGPSPDRPPGRRRQGQGQAQGQAQKPADAAHNTAAAPRSAGRQLQGNRGRLGLEDRAAAGRRAGDDVGDRAEGAQRGAVDQLRGPAAQRAGREHHADFGARRQRDQPRRDQLAGHVAADGRGRPQRVPGFLRLHDVGLRPSNVDEIKRIEVIAGPRPLSGARTRSTASSTCSRVAAREARHDGRRSASAASAAKSTDGAAGGSLFFIRGTHARVANDRWAYKVSAGTY